MCIYISILNGFRQNFISNSQLEYASYKIEEICKIEQEKKIEIEYKIEEICKIEQETFVLLFIKRRYFFWDTRYAFYFEEIFLWWNNAVFISWQSQMRRGKRRVISGE